MLLLGVHSDLTPYDQQVVHAEPSLPSTSQTHRPQQLSRSQRTISHAQSVHPPSDKSAVDPSTVQTKDFGHASSSSHAMPDVTASTSKGCKQPFAEAASPELPGFAMLACNAGRADHSPGEAAVNEAFAVAGCIAQDLVPDSAEEVSPGSNMSDLCKL